LVWYNSCTPLSLYLHYFYILWYNYQDIIAFILFIFKVTMFIVYFDYMLSIVSLPLCLCISSYSTHPNDHRVGGRDHVSIMLRCYLPINTLYILGHMVDRSYNTTVESFVVYSPNIDHRSRARLQRKGKLYSQTF
jgi:hypothetical protein